MIERAYVRACTSESVTSVETSARGQGRLGGGGSAPSKTQRESRSVEVDSLGEISKISNWWFLGLGFSSSRRPTSVALHSTYYTYGKK